VATLFFDTSALVKRYHREPGTEVVDEWFFRPGTRHFISELTIVEMLSVFARQVRERVILESDYRQFRDLFAAGVLNGLLTVEPVEGVHFSRARQLVEKHGTSRSIRTLDAIQLAVALELREQGHADYFMCADRALCALAELEGLAVVNPESPSR
jgi:uncharacterized protein